MRFRKAPPLSLPAAVWRECWCATFTPWKWRADTRFGIVRTSCRWTHIWIEPGATGWGAGRTKRTDFAGCAARADAVGADYSRITRGRVAVADS